MNDWSVIENMDTLKRLASSTLDCTIMLAGGVAGSRKRVKYSPKKDKWAVFNHIDSSRQTLTTEELWTESNIGDALDKRALIYQPKGRA